MYVIETNGYNTKDKIEICKKFILSSVSKEINLDDIIFSDEIIEYIIEKYTNPEKGVRNLKRNIEIIYSKINLFRLLNTSTYIDNKDKMDLFNHPIISVTFPLTITKQMIDSLLPKIDKSPSFLHMYL